MCRKTAVLKITIDDTSFFVAAWPEIGTLSAVKSGGMNELCTFQIPYCICHCHPKVNVVYTR